MLSIEASKIEHRKFILLARYSPDFSRNSLIPEIEQNMKQYNTDSQLVESFRTHKFAENSLYFHHSYAYADIPAGQEYEMIMRISKGKIVPDSIMKCKATVLCFFTVYKPQPIEHANHGHHENSLIQFHDGIPKMINQLYEITEKKPIEIAQEICLCSYETLQMITNRS